MQRRQRPYPAAGQEGVLTAVQASTITSEQKREILVAFQIYDCGHGHPRPVVDRDLGIGRRRCLHRLGCLPDNAAAGPLQRDPQIIIALTWRPPSVA